MVALISFPGLDELVWMGFNFQDKSVFRQNEWQIASRAKLMSEDRPAAAVMYLETT